MASAKHILVIRLSAMGDVAMTVPVLAALTQQYPDLKITLLTRGFFKPMFSQLQNVSVYEADLKGKHKGLLGLFKLFKELKILKIEAVADLHNVLRSKILKIFFTSVGIPVVQIDKGRKEKKNLTAFKDKKFVQLKTTTQRYADVFEKLGFKVSLENVKLYSRTVLSQKTQKIIGDTNKRLIGIAPFAAFFSKMYPLNLMEVVIAKLNDTNKYKILLFGGGADEKEALSKWQAEYSNTINMASNVSFEEELALISNLELMVAMDSGNAHLASIYGVPTISLWGVTHPYAGFYPFGQKMENALLADREKYPLIPTSVYGNKYPEGYENAMQTISPDAVYTKIVQLLN